MSESRFPRVMLRRSITPAMTPGQAGQVRPKAPPTSQSIAPPSEIAVSDNHHFASVVGLSVAVANGVSALFLDQPSSKRNMLMFRNTSAVANIYVEFGKNATTNSVIRLTPNTLMLFDVVVPQDDIYAIADAVGAVLAYSFSTYNP